MVGIPTIITPSACWAGAAMLPAGSSMGAADDHPDDMPTIMPTVLSVGIAGLPTIPTITFYSTGRKQKKGQ